MNPAPRKEYPRLSGHLVHLAAMPEDAEFLRAYCEWLNSDRVVAGIGGGGYTLVDVEELHRRWREDPTDLTLCVFDAGTGAPIGDISLRDIGLEAEMAVMIGARAGEGRGGEAVRLFLGHAFEAMGIPSVRLAVHEDNVPAQRLYRRVGFAPVDVVEDGTGRCDVVMRFERADWMRQRVLSEAHGEASAPEDA